VGSDGANVQRRTTPIPLNYAYSRVVLLLGSKSRDRVTQRSGIPSTARRPTALRSGTIGRRQLGIRRKGSRGRALSHQTQAPDDYVRRISARTASSSSASVGRRRASTTVQNAIP